MREIVHIQAGQCGNQIGAKVNYGPVDYNLMIKQSESLKKAL